ncbi:MAG: asparagine synthase (glutamine-hydrolyzing) [Gammaproteobacteria bacterium]|nr:asparagine synthase (glutamine-hydrolyzing) [Gammaproteobacteria bacterium]
MCGIAGIYYRNASLHVAEPCLQGMIDRIVHRGPDDQGLHIDDNVGLAMRRLSIIDLAGGHQPIFSEDGNQVIVFNGEVYNFRDVKPVLEGRGHRFTTNSDTEVVLNAYLHYGIECFEHLNGMFGLAIWDKPKKQLLIARDRLGIKPLYYYLDEEKVVFASEIKAILSFPGIKPELNRSGLHAYLKYGFTPAPLTLFKNIHKLPPAHYMLLTGEKIEIKRYWTLSYRDKFTASAQQLTEQLYDLLTSAIDYQMISDVPLGAFLSGGIDSSSIVHIMRELGSKHTSTYSIGFGTGYENHNELDAAGRFARDYQTNHHEIVVRPDAVTLFPALVRSLDEPLADSSFIMTYLVSKLARESSTVILSGVGGDELFGGYRRYLNVRLNRLFMGIPRPIRNALIRPIVDALPSDRNSRLLNLARLAKAYLTYSDQPPGQQYASYTSVFREDRDSLLTGPLEDIEDFHQYYFDECDSPDLLDKLLHFDLKTSLPEQLLMLTDKMSMAVSLEARVPYLDHRVVEFAARLPEQLKIKGFTLRHLQKQAFQNRFPEYVFKQKKKGFGAPIGSWMRNELRELVTDLLGESHLKAQGIFNSKTIGVYLNDHFAMKQDYTDNLLALLTFQIWHEEYL